MAKEISRIADPFSKSLVVTLQDEFGSEHIVQQRLLHPQQDLDHAAKYFPDNPRKFLADWDEAMIEDSRLAMKQRADAFREEALARGVVLAQPKQQTAPATAHPVAKIVPDPLSGYKGCCG